MTKISTASGKDGTTQDFHREAAAGCNRILRRARGVGARGRKSGGVASARMAAIPRAGTLVRRPDPRAVPLLTRRAASERERAAGPVRRRRARRVLQGTVAAMASTTVFLLRTGTFFGASTPSRGISLANWPVSPSSFCRRMGSTFSQAITVAWAGSLSSGTRGSSLS